MKNVLPDINDYNDFRCFLEEYRIVRKKDDPQFTHKYICARLGLPHTRGFFNNIVKGRRTLTDSNVERFIKLLELSDDDARYFRILVKYNQAQTRPEKDIYLGQLIALSKSPARQLDEKAFIYYKDWYNSVIRALLGIIDFDGNFSNLAKKVCPSISTKAARDSVRLQLDLGLLVKNNRNIIKPSEAAIATGPLMRNEIIQQYQLQCLELAKQTIRAPGSKKYSMSTNVIGVSDAGYEQLMQKVKQFKSEIRALIQKDKESPSKVYHLNIFLFPGSV
ncbi:MAG: TIGR02147 family protein [Chitinispirillaceae bacterium]|nr:TIGR02147 family protein [Chitinispirillaceae bacterium]